MPTFSRIKTWVSNEVLTASDLNAEFNNLLNNMTPTGIDDASASTSDMQATTDPGGVGTESQATDLLGEIKRLRYKIKQIIGGAQWYSTPVIDLGSTIGTADIADDAVTTAKILNLNVTTAKIADAAITQAKRAALGQQISSSSGTYSGVAAADVTNLSVSITTTGRPVKIQLISDGTANDSYIYGTSTTGSAAVRIYIQRDGVTIAQYLANKEYNAGAAQWIYVPSSAVSYIEVPAAGTYTYKIRAEATGTGGSPTCRVYYTKLAVYEL